MTVDVLFCFLPCVVIVMVVFCCVYSGRSLFLVGGGEMEGNESTIGVVFSKKSI